MSQIYTFIHISGLKSRFLTAPWKLFKHVATIIHEILGTKICIILAIFMAKPEFSDLSLCFRPNLVIREAEVTLLDCVSWLYYIFISFQTRSVALKYFRVNSTAATG